MSITAPLVGGKKTEKVELAADVFGVEATEGLLHEVVKAEAAARRQGTHATKTRGMVAGGRAKPWRQKGTGRARQGTTRASQWTGGGVTFGPQPRDYSMKVNRKAYRKARAMALSQHATNGTIGVFDASKFAEPKTKQAVALAGGWRDDVPLVVVVASDESGAGLSFRNLDRTVVLVPNELEVTDLLRARSLLVSKAALEEISTAVRGASREEVAA